MSAARDVVARLNAKLRVPPSECVLCKAGGKMAEYEHVHRRRFLVAVVKPTKGKP